MKHPQDFRLAQGLSCISAGGVVAYPTEAVWGLGCDPWNEAAVMRLLALKARPVNKGLILVAAAMNQFDWLLEDLSKADLARLSLSWPGPVTWLVPHGDRVPHWICGQHATVAIRVSAHYIVKALCTGFGSPLVSTSANVAGSQPARQQFQVYKHFGTRLDGVVPGKLGDSANPTVIRDLVSDRILRPG